MASKDPVSKNEWVEIVRKKLQTADFEILNCELKPLDAGAGFMGEHRLAELKVRLLNKECSQSTLNFFIKTSPEALESQKKVVELTGLFVKEVEAIRCLFKEFRSVLKDEGKYMKWSCECYLARKNLIVMEDLLSQGYYLAGTRETYTFEHCALVLKALANMHSASLIFEETRYDKPCSLEDTHKEVVSECFFVDRPNHPGIDWLRAGTDGTLYLLERIYGKEKYLEMKDDLEKFLMGMFEFHKPSNTFRNVVCHGDIWKSNILFKQESGRLVVACPVDFQFLRYAPPANDVISFLYLCTNREFRNNHASKLMSLYYEHLSNNLKNHGLDANSILPWEEFDRSCEFYKPLGIILICFEGQIIYMKEEDMKQILHTDEDFMNLIFRDRKRVIEHALQYDTYYKENVTAVIEELLDVFPTMKTREFL